MALVNVANASIGTALMGILMADDIEPGNEPSYALCKDIYAFHPLGKKLVDAPIELAMSQSREISITTAPERVREAFEKEWVRIGADEVIANTVSTSRMYGIASCAVVFKDEDDPARELDFDALWKSEIGFNVFDPLNTAGSLVLNLQPNAFDFLKSTTIAVNGQRYHRSRAMVQMNERPLYLKYTTSSFGFVGRSVYQRPLYSLKSYISTMIADNMVARKAGLIVAKMKPAGSITDGLMMGLFGRKRQMLQEGQTDNVLGIDVEESIETLNMQNVHAAMKQSRDNILTTIAACDDMPAVLLNNETLANGFREGTEDAKVIARYADGKRREMKSLYDFFDKIVQYRAWNPEFYATIQRDEEEYRNVSYEEALTSWRNGFAPKWPSLIEEPDSEKVKVADTKLKAIIALVQVLLPEMDPTNKAIVIEWAQDNFNEIEELFESPLVLDLEALQTWAEEQAEKAAQIGQSGEGEQEPAAPPPFSARDSAGVGRLKKLVRIVGEAAD